MPALHIETLAPCAGRTLVIGDVHGCADELETLIAAFAPGPQDRLIAAGDLINRGPDSPRVLRIARHHSICCVLGNHEQRLLQAWQSSNPATLKEKDRATFAALADALAHFEAAEAKAGGASPGPLATYYRGATLFRLGRREEAIEALLDRTGPYADALTFAESYELGLFESAMEVARDMGVAEHALGDIYAGALSWADEMLAPLTSTPVARVG